MHLKLRALKFQINNQLETEDSTKKLIDTLIMVRPATIARWNEHKDVKEDKERDPCFFVPNQKASDVDPKIEIQDNEKEKAPDISVSIPFTNGSALVGPDPHEFPPGFELCLVKGTHIGISELTFFKSYESALLRIQHCAFGP